MDSFRGALQALRQHFTAQGDKALVQGLCLEDGSNVIFSAVDNQGSSVRCSVAYLDSDNYPVCPALVVLEGREELAGTLSDQFQDSAPLHKVVSKVLQGLGHGSVELPDGGTAKPATAGRDRRVSDPMEEDSRGGSDSDINDDVSMDGGGSGGYEYGSAQGGDEDEDGGGGGGGSDDDDDDGDSEDDDEERDMIILCGSNLGRWERFEAACEEAESRGKGALSSTQGVAAKRQIFEPKEAFAMLSRELNDFYRAQRFDYGIQTAGDNVYDWLVDLGSFSPGAPLAKDMVEVQRRYVYSTVRLRIRFKRGLHPFYPPSCEVVYPRLAPPLLAAVASHPMLCLDNWDPWRSQLDMVDQIKKFLEACARVEVDSAANDIGRYRTSCYAPLERCLARLEALSGVQALCKAQYEALYTARDAYEKDTARLQALAESKKRAREEAPPGPGPSSSSGGKGGADGKDGGKEDAAGGAGKEGGKEGKEGKGAAGAAAASAAKEAAKDKDKRTVWARGTGYGSGQERSSELWDAKASEAAQRARDEETRALLETLRAALVHELGPAQGTAPDGSSVAEGTADDGGGCAAAAAASGGEAAAAAQQQQPAAASGGGAAAAGGCSSAGASGGNEVGGGGSAIVADDPDSPRLGAEGVPAALAGSCLLPFLVRELELTSFADMGARYPYYLSLLKLVRQLCRPATHDLLGVDVGGCRSLLGLVAASLRPSASRYVTIIGPTHKKDQQQAASGGASSSKAPLIKPTERQLASAEQAAKEAEATLEVAHTILAVAKYAERQGLAPAPAGAAAQGGAAAGAGADAGGASTSSSGPSEYIRAMKPLQVDTVSGLASDAKFHYASQLRSDTGSSKKRSVKLAREVASLDGLLPLNDSSSVFVRVDEQQAHAWKVLIVGPEDTPYSGGCFIFDFYFPQQYPDNAPQVNLETTGGGRVRFNPNLYNCGKVCLSLLGTWSGNKGETWNPDASSAYQVLVSIQSLIMVPDPYFNEPGYETRGNMQESRNYNMEIREQCVRYAMIEMLKHPPACFREVVKEHFRLRKDFILRQIRQWIDETTPHNPAKAQALQGLLTQLQDLLPREA